MADGDVTELLAQWRGGDEAALNELVPRVYDELHRLAFCYLRRERDDHTLQPTALVNEAFLKLAGQNAVAWQNRAHFFGIAAQSMRRILVDHARSHNRAKRGGGAVVVQLDTAIDLRDEKAGELVALDDALQALAQLDDQQSRIVELRYFGGLSVDETAEVLGISKSTVHRDWATARAFLAREIARSESA